MCSTTGFNIPSIDIDYSNVACRHDSALIDAEGELLLGISAIIRLNYDRMIFSNYPVCHTLDLFYFFSCKCGGVRDIKPAVAFFLKCRVLPDPGAKCIPRGGVEDMGCCMMLGNKITPCSIYRSMYSLSPCSFLPSTFNFVSFHIGLLRNFYYVDVFNLSGVRLLSSAPWVKGRLVQNDILASHHLEHLCMKMAY